MIAQGTEFPLRKPAGFHWDVFLLGLTTGVAGLLGIPFPNGLIPQAPFHTNSLCVTRQVSNDSEDGKGKGHAIRVTDHVVEQRVSILAQGLLTLGTMSGPLLVVLHVIPQGVLAGLFFIMGVQALEANGITNKVLFLCVIETSALLWILYCVSAAGAPCGTLSSSKSWALVLHLQSRKVLRP